MQDYIGRVYGGRYKILRAAGRGGSAGVFCAEDLMMHRLVALKILNGDESEYLINSRSFETEIQAISRLSHPHIVSVYDVAVEDGERYIVMEYVDGISLRDYIDHKKPMAISEAFEATKQILRALGEAHRNGIVHRDIKPQNIMVTREGKIKVTDFGIARLPGRDHFAMAERAIGTVQYISPEQASGGTVDARSDIYSVGILLYEMVTGRRPFDGPSASQVAMMQVTEMPESPRKYNSAVSPGLEQLIMRALEKNPDSRFQSAEEMLEHLKHLSRDYDFVFGTTTMFLSPEESSAKKGTAGGAGRSAGRTEAVPTEQIPAVRRQSRGRDDAWGADLRARAVTAPASRVSAPAGHAVVDYIQSKQRMRALPWILFAVAVLLLAGAVALSVYLYRGRATGGPDATVPSLVGRVYDASDRISGAEFQVSYVYSDEMPAGVIVSQSPAAGTPAVAHYTLSLTVSRGRESFALGEIVGAQASDVCSRLEQELGGHGLRISRRYVTDESPAGQVLSYTVNGTENAATAENNASVVLRVSAGAGTAVVMPDLVGTGLGQAEQSLEALGLSYRILFVSDEAQRGRVTVQSEAAGSSLVAETSTVTITVGR